MLLAFVVPDISSLHALRPWKILYGMRLTNLAGVTLFGGRDHSGRDERAISIVKSSPALPVLFRFVLNCTTAWDCDFTSKLHWDL
jgi:hypothetical protein